VQLDSQLKQLLKELGNAINETVSDSDRISEAIANLRAAGFDIVLKLDATIGLARRDNKPLQITTNDKKFLEALHIRVDDAVIDEDAAAPAVRMTAQDIRFLKSLKITLDDSL